MKRISKPAHDDVAALQLLAGNTKLKSYPMLRRAVPVLIRAYGAYSDAGGKANAIRRVRVGSARADFLRRHYKSLPGNLAHIRSMREESEHLCCPMCGSFHSGTLDHVLPKEDHPAFAVFSMNLVPACKCNSKRGRISVGPRSGERVLHPYFDDCLNDRLMVAQFSDLGEVPRVDVVVAAVPMSVDFAAISFHVNLVREKTAVKRYLADRWATMCRKPSLVVRSFESAPSSRDSLEQQIELELARLDDEHGSKNNWNSVFVAGLLADGVVEWLFAKLTSPGRVADSELIAV